MSKVGSSRFTQVIEHLTALEKVIIEVSLPYYLGLICISNFCSFKHALCIVMDSIVDHCYPIFTKRNEMMMTELFSNACQGILVSRQIAGVAYCCHSFAAAS